MTNEEMDRAIAEAVGWTRIWDPSFRQWTQRSPDGSNVTCDPDPASGWDISRIPRYSTDLNAMHEAEKTLTDEQHRLFRSYLGEVVGDVAYFCRKIVSSEAHHRAEAFLRTIGKYHATNPLS